MQMQEDEIQLLKMALADVLKRLNISEEHQAAAAMAASRRPTATKGEQIFVFSSTYLMYEQELRFYIIFACIFCVYCAKQLITMHQKLLVIISPPKQKSFCFANISQNIPRKSQNLNTFLNTSQMSNLKMNLNRTCEYLCFFIIKHPLTISLKYCN